MNDFTNMKIFIVFELAEKRELVGGRGYVGGIPEDAYIVRRHPEIVGVYVSDTPERACIQAARNTRRVGNYLAVEAVPLQIDFTAGLSQLLIAESEEVEGEVE